MMSRKCKLLIITILSLIFILGSSVTLAYLFVTGNLNDNDNHDGIIGIVDYDVSLYHENEPLEDITAKEVVFNDKNKPGVYELNVSEMDDYYHINKFRVNFTNNSNIKTYLRVKALSTLTLTYENNQGVLVEVSTAEQVDFNIDDELWYYDKATQWYYYKGIISEDDNSISFINSGLEYDLRSPQYIMQFTLVFEAVQSHLGPIKNGWGVPPWGGEW